MGFSLEHVPALVPMGEYMSGLGAGEIAKVRETQHGGIVVIDLEGRKRTFDGEQYRKAQEDFASGRQGSFESVEAREVRVQDAAKQAPSKKHKAKS